MAERAYGWAEWLARNQVKDEKGRLVRRCAHVSATLGNITGRPRRTLEDVKARFMAHLISYAEVIRHPGGPDGRTQCA